MAFNYTSKAIKFTDDGGYLRKEQVPIQSSEEFEPS